MTAMLTAKLHTAREDGRPAKARELWDELAGQFETVPQGLRVEFVGEASRCQAVIWMLVKLARENRQAVPCISTYLPRDDKTRSFPSSAINTLNEDYSGAAPEFEWVIWSTSESQRKKKLGDVFSLSDIGRMLEKYPQYRAGKIVLSLFSGADINVEKLRNVFDPRLFAVHLAGTGGEETKAILASMRYDIREEKSGEQAQDSGA